MSKKKKSSSTAAEHAAEILPALAVTFFAQGNALTPQTAPISLHNFRIQAKRFRDTLELFRPCYTRRLERLLKSLRDVQQILGELNDLVTIRQLLSANGLEQSRRDMLDHLDKGIAEKRSQFFSVWQKIFARSNGEARWVNYLASRSLNDGQTISRPASDLGICC